MGKPRLSRGPRRLYKPKPISMPTPPAPAAATPVPEPTPAWDPFPVPPTDTADRLVNIARMIDDIRAMVPGVISAAFTRGQQQATHAAADALPPLTRLDGPEGGQFVRLATVDCISNPILLEPKGMTKMKIVRYLTLQSGAKVMVLDTLHNRTVLQLAGEGTPPATNSDEGDDD